jgi:hypothetical protein
MRPQHIDGEYAVLWDELQRMEVDGKVVVGPEKFEQVRELESLGGCTVTSEKENEMTVELIHQPEEAPADEEILMASKPTKFAEKNKIS